MESFYWKKMTERHCQPIEYLHFVQNAKLSHNAKYFYLLQVILQLSLCFESFFDALLEGEVDIIALLLLIVESFLKNLFDHAFHGDGRVALTFRFGYVLVGEGLPLFRCYRAIEKK